MKILVRFEYLPTVLVRMCLFRGFVYFFSRRIVGGFVHRIRCFFCQVGRD